MITTAMQETIEEDLRRIGVAEGDTILIRARLSAVGKINRASFLQALLNVAGNEGTIVSLAFTEATFPWRINQLEPFTLNTPSYAGPLPNTMLKHPSARRSKHPQCSFVAIGKNAEFLTADHGPHAGAYEPVRKLIQLQGKMILVGCVFASPGFTTTHLAEIDLGLYRRRIAPWLGANRYVDDNGNIQVFKRKDSGLCSNSFWKFYSAYVRNEVLNTGRVGKAYSILADAGRCYQIEREILEKNPRFSSCDSLDCAACNALRWDRIYQWPAFILHRLARLIESKTSKSIRNEKLHTH